MYTFILILFIIVCILLILLILLQSSRASSMELFGGSSQNIFGAQTGDILTKATTVLATLFFIGTITLAMFQAKKSSIVEEQIKKLQKNGPQQSEQPEEPQAPGTNLPMLDTNR